MSNQNPVMHAHQVVDMFNEDGRVAIEAVNLFNRKEKSKFLFAVSGLPHLDVGDCLIYDGLYRFLFKCSLDEFGRRQMVCDERFPDVEYHLSRGGRKLTNEEMENACLMVSVVSDPHPACRIDREKVESTAGHTGELRQQITALQLENETLRQENARLKAQDNLVEGSKNSQVHAVWNASKGFR